MFTINDHRTLMALASEADEYGRVQITNAELGYLLGLKPAAASSRLHRLENMELIEVDYIQEGGRVVGKKVRVRRVPTQPYDTGGIPDGTTQPGPGTD